MAVDPLTAMREVALALPGVAERATMGHPTFRVEGKIFVAMGVDDDGVTAATMKAPPGEQERLVAEGDPFFVPLHVGATGWVGVRLDDTTDWKRVGQLVADSYREIAPRSLSAGVGLRPGPPSRGAQMVVRVGNIIGELVEGKPPRDQAVAEAEASDDQDDGLKLSFDPDDPTSTSISLDDG